jgi:lipopolysaccharide export system protein LptC
MVKNDQEKLYESFTRVKDSFEEEGKRRYKILANFVNHYK